MNTLFGQVNPLKCVLTGNWMLVFCTASYFFWWLITFSPPEPKGTAAGSLLLILAFLSGIAGFCTAGRGLAADTETVTPGFPTFSILICGIAFYVILLAISTLVFHRQVTSELLIITVWGTFEACILNFLYKTSSMGAVPLRIMSVVVALAVLMSFICYLLYYRLPYTAGYIDGCIPLVLCGAVTAAINMLAGSK